MPRLHARHANLILAVAALVALGAASTAAAKKPAEEPEKADLLFNVTSGKEDLHAVTMAFQLANHGLEDGRAVTLFFNVRAVEFASTSCSDKLAFGGNPPLTEMLAALIDKGATMIVCPHCWEAMGYGEGDLVEGVTLADREKVFGPLDAGAAVFTY